MFNKRLKKKFLSNKTILFNILKSVYVIVKLLQKKKYYEQRKWVLSKTTPSRRVKYMYHQLSSFFFQATGFSQTSSLEVFPTSKEKNPYYPVKSFFKYLKWEINIS